MGTTVQKQKPLLTLVLSMSLPMVLSMLVSSLYNIIDSFFVAKISENAMTALSLVFPVQNFINAVAIGFSIGVNAAIAYYLGAEEQEEADRAATQGVLLNVLHGVVMMVVCTAIMPAFLKMFTSDPETLSFGLRYSRIAFAFSVVVTLDLAFEKTFQAVGSMVLTMVSMMAGCVANIILDPLMIFGIGPFPEMGIEGAALATGIGQVVTLAVYLAAYLTRPCAVTLRRSCLKPTARLLVRLYATGIPATLNMALSSLLISVLNVLLAAYSQTYVLVLGVYYKLQTFLYLPANGIVQGIRPLVGFSYGAREYQRIRSIYRIALGLAAGIMALGTLLCWLCPGQLIGLFTDSWETVQIGAAALRIISLGFLVSSVSIISCGSLEGLGMGPSSLVISLLRYVVLILPAAFLLSRGLGAIGVWWAFPLTEAVAAALSYMIYRRSTRFP